MSTTPIDGLSAQEEAAFAAMQDERPIEQAATEAEESEIGGDEEAENAPESQARKPSTVPHQALHAERERRRAVEKELQQAREDRARFDERLRIMQERSQPQREEPQLPNPQEDPIGALEALQRQLAERDQREREQRREHEQQTQQQQEYNQFVGAYRQQVDEYSQSEPALRDAYNHFVKSRIDEIRAVGYDQQTAAKIFEDEELRIAAMAMQQGVNPGERIVSLAKMRGWAPRAAGDEAEERVAATREAVSRGKTLAGTGGGAAITEMTVEKLLKMSDDEFDAWTSKNPAKTKRLMGN
jgi:hypothetical protein